MFIKYYIKPLQYPSVYGAYTTSQKIFVNNSNGMN